MKRYWFCILLVFSACFSRHAMMTREVYEDTMLGTPASELVAKAGSPYSIRKTGSETVEYEYIEHIAVDDELVSDNHYYFTIVNGQIVNKRISREKRPAYDLIYQADPNYPNYP